MITDKLMCGNWIGVRTAQSNDYFTQIIETRSDGYSYRKDKTKGVAIKSYPISLTPEILEKCPEIKEEHGDFFFEHKGIRYKVEQQDDWWFIGIKPDAKTTTYFIWHLYNLHQFQNAFYALTGTELTITP